MLYVQMGNWGVFINFTLVKNVVIFKIVLVMWIVVLKVMLHVLWYGGLFNNIYLKYFD